jgi:hypothetical protein
LWFCPLCCTHFCWMSFLWLVSFNQMLYTCLPYEWVRHNFRIGQVWTSFIAICEGPRNQVWLRWAWTLWYNKLCFSSNKNSLKKLVHNWKQVVNYLVIWLGISSQVSFRWTLSVSHSLYQFKISQQYQPNYFIIVVLNFWFFIIV